jgi:hypothetical protein
MPVEPSHNKTPTYLAVIAIEILVICSLWLFSQHFAG